MKKILQKYKVVYIFPNGGSINNLKWYLKIKAFNNYVKNK